MWVWCLVLVVAQGLPPGYVVLNPQDFAPYLVDDVGNHLDWAVANIPFLDYPLQELLQTYYFRWTSYRKHIFHYSDVGYVITEFLPNVPWAGKYNTIPCAAGHHIAEGRWLHNVSVVDDYGRFWFRGGGDPRRYTYWATTAIYRRLQVTGDIGYALDLLPDLVTNLYGWRRTHYASYGGMGCYWQSDGADGGEVSIGKNGCRPTINAAMYAEFDSVLHLVELAKGNTSVAVPLWGIFFCCPSGNCSHPGFLWEGIAHGDACRAKCSGTSHCTYFTTYSNGDCQLSAACEVRGQSRDQSAITHEVDGKLTSVREQFTEWRDHLQGFILNQLWNPNITAFATRSLPAPSMSRLELTSPGRSATPSTDLRCPPAWPTNQTVSVRELLGYTPWYFGVLPKDTGAPTVYENMWTQLNNTEGFAGPWGLRTAERRSPCYNYSGTWHDHECNWNGPSWPYETSRVLTGLSNLLNDYPHQTVVDKPTYYTTLMQYVHQHTKTTAINGSHPWIGEDLHPDLGYWIARWVMYMKKEKDRNRGHNYNHSTFIDLILNGLLGLRPSTGRSFTINPLIPRGEHPKWFAVDHILYHSHELCFLWDVDGTRYHKGQGLRVFIDGKLVATTATLSSLTVTLPQWVL